MSINFLPWRNDLKKKKINFFIMQVLIIILLSIFVCIIFYAAVYQEALKKENEMKILFNKIYLANSVNREALSFISSAEGKKAINFLQNRIDKNVIFSDILFWLGQNIPHTLYLEKIESKLGFFYIYGKASTQIDVVSFVKNLEDEFRIKISIDEVNRIENEDYKTDFLISLV